MNTSTLIITSAGITSLITVAVVIIFYARGQSLRNRLARLAKRYHWSLASNSPIDWNYELAHRFPMIDTSWDLEKSQTALIPKLLAESQRPPYKLALIVTAEHEEKDNSKHPSVLNFLIEGLPLLSGEVILRKASPAYSGPLIISESKAGMKQDVSTRVVHDAPDVQAIRKWFLAQNEAHGLVRTTDYVLIAVYNPSWMEDQVFSQILKTFEDFYSKIQQIYAQSPATTEEEKPYRAA